MGKTLLLATSARIREKWPWSCLRIIVMDVIARAVKASRARSPGTTAGSTKGTASRSPSRRAIDAMLQTNHAPYPVERTLLTTGILDAVMISKVEKNRRVETPHLKIRYQPTEWGFATDPLPARVK